MSTLSGPLSCAQTPLQYPNMDPTFNPSAMTSLVNNYGNAGLRLWSIIPGSGRAFSSNDSASGIYVDENIQCSLTVNGVSYTLFDMRIYNAAHKIFPSIDISGQTLTSSNVPYVTAVLEVYIFFKDNRNNIFALVLPIGIDDSKLNTYASQYIGGLTNLSDGNSKQPTLSTLFQDLSGSTPGGSFNTKNHILQYIGQDVRKINCNDKTATPNPVTYLVIMNDMKSTKLLSSTLTRSQYNKFINMLQTVDRNIQNSPTPISQSAITENNLVYIPGGTFFITNSRSGSSSSNVSTSALKCYPVDPSKNVKDGQLYLDENGVPIPFPDGSIPASNININPPSVSFWTSAAGIETIVAITVACIFASIGLWLLSWYYFDEIKTGASRVGSAVATGASRVGSALATGATTVGSAVATGATTVGSAVATGATTVGSAVATGATTVGSAVATGASRVGSAVGSAATSASTTPWTISPWITIISIALTVGLLVSTITLAVLYATK
jgi:hypothetical protein